MVQYVHRFSLALFAVLCVAVWASMAMAQERFEVTSIKAVRPTLVATIGALERGDVAGAKEAFEAFDSAWNGIETYVNVRSKAMYDELEHGFQARIEKALSSPTPDVAAVLAEAKAMLAKFDEMVAMVAAKPPLNPLYDDIARLRIVRAHLREVNPALKAGNFAKARKSFQAFDDNWDSIEDLIKERSADAYVAIEKTMIEIEQALMSDKPDVGKVSAMVNEIMRLYNAQLAEVVKEARGRG